jgi:hypothetical protein
MFSWANCSLISSSVGLLRTLFFKIFDIIQVLFFTLKFKKRDVVFTPHPK